MSEIPVHKTLFKQLNAQGEYEAHYFETTGDLVKLDSDSTGLHASTVEGALGELASMVVESMGSLPFVATSGTASAFVADASFSGENGRMFLVKFHTQPADGATLSISGTGAYPIMFQDGMTPIVGAFVPASGVWPLVYVDGAYLAVGVNKARFNP